MKTWEEATERVDYLKTLENRQNTMEQKGRDVGEKLQIGSNPCPCINHQHLPELGCFQLDALNLKHDSTSAKHVWFMAYTYCVYTLKRSPSDCQDLWQA